MIFPYSGTASKTLKVGPSPSLSAAPFSLSPAVKKASTGRAPAGVGAKGLWREEGGVWSSLAFVFTSLCCWSFPLSVLWGCHPVSPVTKKTYEKPRSSKSSPRWSSRRPAPLWFSRGWWLPWVLPSPWWWGATWACVVLIQWGDSKTYLALQTVYVLPYDSRSGGSGSGGEGSSSESRCWSPGGDHSGGGPGVRCLVCFMTWFHRVTGLFLLGPGLPVVFWGVIGLLGLAVLGRLQIISWLGSSRLKDTLIYMRLQWTSYKAVSGWGPGFDLFEDKIPCAFLKMAYPNILVPKFSWHKQLFMHVWHL